MELFYNLRLKAGRIMLRRRLTGMRRNKQDFNLEMAKKIGILWDASSEKDFQHIAALNRHLTDMGKSVLVMAWIPGKDVPDKLSGLAYMQYLRRADLSWAYFPVSEDAKKFISTKFDLVIDINPSGLFQLTSIAALSSATMKVGPDITDQPEHAPYDLMIKPAKAFSIIQFIEQSLHYLSMIGSPAARA